MSDRGRGGLNRTEHRAYEDYDDQYATPRSRRGKYNQQYGERSYRDGGKYNGPATGVYQPQYPSPSYSNDAYAMAIGPSYGQQPSWGQGRPNRAPYSTGQPRQYQEPPYPGPPESARTERSGGRWGGRPPSARPPSNGGGLGNGYTARALNSVLGGGGGGGSGGGGGGGPGAPLSARQRTPRAPSAGGSSSGGGNRQTSRGRTTAGPLSAGSSSGGEGRSRSNSRSGGATGRVRAPYVTQTDPAALVPVAAAPSESPAPEEPQLPSNPHFMTPAFPQPPRTRTDSCNTWALMVEASSQTLEAVVGPFLEGVLMELFGESWERELFGMELALPPFSAATCADLVSRCKQLHEHLPITIHKRVEAVQKATAALASSPASLEPEDVITAHSAMKGMLQDCIKAMKMPSLLGEGSRQFRAFTGELVPHAESTLLYYDMLLADCTEAAAARQQVRGGGPGGAAGGLALLPTAPAEAASP